MARDRLDARAYTWEELYGLRAILDFTRGRTVVREADLDNARDARSEGDYEVFRRWATALRYVEEALVFDNGQVMVCASTATWGGTFQSHDDVSVRYYGLTPR